MKIKTSEATGKQLDWGAGKVLQLEKLQLAEGGVIYKPSSGGRQVLRHTDPAVCMGLIEQYKPDLVYRAEEWGAEIPHNNNRFWSPCLARAVARCVIAMRLGDEFEVPDELGGVSDETI